MLSDDGFGHVLLIPDREGVDTDPVGPVPQVRSPTRLTVNHHRNRSVQGHPLGRIFYVRRKRIMLHFYDRATMAHALMLDLEPTLKALLRARIKGLSPNLLDYTEYLVVEPGDSEAEIVRHVGFSPLINPIDGARFGEAGFHPFWDYTLQTRRLVRTDRGHFRQHVCIYSFGRKTVAGVIRRHWSTLCRGFCGDRNSMNIDSHVRNAGTILPPDPLFQQSLAVHRSDFYRHPWKSRRHQSVLSQGTAWNRLT